MDGPNPEQMQRWRWLTMEQRDLPWDNKKAKNTVAQALVLEAMDCLLDEVERLRADKARLDWLGKKSVELALYENMYAMRLVGSDVVLGGSDIREVVDKHMGDEG